MDCDPPSSECLGNPYVVVDSAQKVFEDVKLYIRHRKPVLLSGPAGCGKSSLLHHIASLSGRNRPPQLISIQLCRDIDGRVRFR